MAEVKVAIAKTLEEIHETMSPGDVPVMEIEVRHNAAGQHAIFVNDEMLGAPLNSAEDAEIVARWYLTAAQQRIGEMLDQMIAPEDEDDREGLLGDG